MKTAAVAFFSLTFLAVVALSLSEEAKQAPVAPAPSQAPAVQAEPAPEFVVIGHLRNRDRVVTIKSGPQGTVYSVAGKDGKLLHENLSIEQLKAQMPELHDLIKTGTAGGGDARIRLDAGLPETR